MMRGMRLTRRLGIDLLTVWRAAGRTLATLRDRRLLWLLLLLLALLGAAARLPRDEWIDVGREDGLGSDLPLVQAFHAAEQSGAERFRWSGDQSALVLPGAGWRPIRLMVRTLGRDPGLPTAPTRLAIEVGGRAFGPLLLGDAPRRHHVLLPPMRRDDTIVRFVSATFQAPGDPRALGVPLGDVALRLGAGWPAPAVLGGWAAIVVLGWLILRGCGVAPGAAWRTSLLALGLLGCAVILDPLRAAAAIMPALSALAGGAILALALIGRPAVLRGALCLALCAAPPLALLHAAAVALAAAGLWAAAIVLRHHAARIWLTPGPAARRRLVLLAVVVFCLRLGGKWYPAAMPGDIQFHLNRAGEVIAGQPLLRSNNRGVDFPYPPALYLLVAPATLLDPGLRATLRIVAALGDALGPLVLYQIAQRLGLGRRRAWYAAWFGAANGAAMMANWWNFSTHAATQLWLLVAVWLVTCAWPALRGGRWPAGWIALLTLAQVLVALGHFGFWINLGVLTLAGLGMLPVAARRDAGWRRGAARLALSAGIAQVLALALFYSAYGGLFASQLAQARQGGLGALAEQVGAERAVLWADLWDAGFRQHLGPVTLPAALAGGLWLALRPPDRSGRRRLVSGLLAGTALVALCLAALPFITTTSLTTRWLSFSVWAVALGGGAVAAELWRRGRAGRWAVWAAAASIAWGSAALWLGALAWRIRPPEPF